jgi:cell division protein FtsI (penicillin-binding protein 3)/stage V sporulation protein D (sporulation-specific penicillin-binding protein)
MREWRINLILIFLFFFGAALAGKLFFLQIVEHDFYSALARGQQKILVTGRGERGEIFFQNHDLPIATNQTAYYLYASPNEIPFGEKEEIAARLSEIVALGKDFILGKLKKNSLYEVLKDELPPPELEKLEELELKGVYLGQEIRRVYPYGKFASHILGFVNKDGQGQYGLEEYWDEALQGKEKLIKGSDLILTVDYNIQYQAEKLLKKVHKELAIDGGTIIVIQPESGRILALADFPSFDPNQYSKVKDFEIFQLDATQKIFEPGSVFKPITMAGALNEGKITPATTYQDPGIIEIDGWPIYNYEQRIYPGEITMTGVLEKSINTGAVFAERQLGHRDFLKYIEKFGIFKKTGIDLWGEAYSSNEDFKRGYEINFATAAFGQGIEMTPIQIARAFCVIANGGKLVKPYLVEKIKNSDNEVIEITPEVSSEEVISPAIASKLTAMLVSVVENGFGKAARIPGYYVAGKTGTAQVSWSALGVNKKGYSEKTWQSFIGFAPAFNPQFLILVKLDDPATKTAEYSAVPIFQELAKYIINYYQIAPDYE